MAGGLSGPVPRCDMRALAAVKTRDYFVIVQCMLTGNDGREKFVVCFPGTEERLLQERQERIKVGWKVE
jgi:hypothetical protein